MTLSQKAVSRLYGRAAEYKISAKALAEASGISRVTLSNWRNDRSAPMLEAFLVVERALDEMIEAKVDA
jgi:transcriptional regulator with XRE-family HTH domain